MSPVWWHRTRPAPPAEHAAGWMEEFPDILDSAQTGLAFTAVIRLEWRRIGTSLPAHTSRSEARRAVRVLAEQVAKQHSVLRPEATEQDINHELTHRVPLRPQGAEVTWARVTLAVDSETRRYALRTAEARREMELDMLTRRQTLDRVSFMYDEILRSPASARIYLMLENSARLGALPPDMDVDTVVREVQQWHPESKWVVVAQLLHTFVSRLSPADANDLLHDLRALFLDHGEKELAEKVPVETAQAPE